jgi:hypothetical protein
MIDPRTFDLSNIRVRAPSRAKPLASDGGRLVVCPFRVVVDSREQLPYEFSGMTGATGEAIVVPTVVTGLHEGDYSIEGFESGVIVERKSLEDLYGSVTRWRDRFEAELKRLDAMIVCHRGSDTPAFAAVVIEAGWPEIMSPGEWRPGWINRTEPRSVEGTIVAWSIRYPRVHWWACGNRRGAECRTFSILRKFWEEATGTDCARHI